MARTTCVQCLADGNPGHVYALHDCPHDGETTRFRRERINLIGSLPHITEKAFDGVSRANGAMQNLRKGVKREQMVFVLHQAADRFGIALLVLAFEGRQLSERRLFGWRLPDSRQLGSDRAALTFRNGTHDVALFMDHTALAWGGCKESMNRCQQAVVPIGDNEIHLSGTTSAHVLEQAHPPFLAFFCAGTQGEHLFVAFQIHSQSRYKDRGIGLVSMTYGKVDSIQ